MSSTGYRPQWVVDILDNRSILSCALDVHMTTSGSYERSREDQLKDVKVLQYIIDSWRESLKLTKRFDDAVLGVIITALQEFALAEVATMNR
jgi:hypothetical protein